MGLFSSTKDQLAATGAEKSPAPIAIGLHQAVAVQAQATTALMFFEPCFRSHMNSGISTNVKSHRRRAVCTQPPELRFVARTTRVVKNEEMTLSEITELMVATRICTLGYHKTSASTETSSPQGPNAGLLSSADKGAKLCQQRAPLIPATCGPGALFVCPTKGEVQIWSQMDGAKITHMQDPRALLAFACGL